MCALCAQRIRALRRAFDIADVDGNDRLEKAELQTVLFSLHPCSPSSDDVDYLWRILCGQGKQPIALKRERDCNTSAQRLTKRRILCGPGWAQTSFLSWCDFLHGMAAVRADARATQLMDLNRPNEWALISLLVDVKCSEEQVHALMKGLSFFERVGVSSHASRT